MVTMRAEVFGIKVMTRMNLRDRAADFAFKLAAFFTVVKVKILRRGGARPADGIIRDFGLRVDSINRF